MNSLDFIKQPRTTRTIWTIYQTPAIYFLEHIENLPLFLSVLYLLFADDCMTNPMIETRGLN